MESDWVKAISSILFALFAAIFGVIWHRQDRHEANDEERFQALSDKLDQLKADTVPRSDLQSLVYESIIRAIRDTNSDYRGEVGRQMGLLAGRLDDIMGQIERLRMIASTNQRDIVILSTKVGVSLSRDLHE